MRFSPMRSPRAACSSGSRRAASLRHRSISCTSRRPARPPSTSRASSSKWAPAHAARCWSTSSPSARRRSSATSRPSSRSARAPPSATCDCTSTGPPRPRSRPGSCARRPGAATNSICSRSAVACCARIFDLVLDGAHAACRLDGLFLADGERQVDLLTQVTHRGVATETVQEYRGIALARGRGALQRPHHGRGRRHAGRMPASRAATCCCRHSPKSMRGRNWRSTSTTSSAAMARQPAPSTTTSSFISGRADSTRRLPAPC